MKRVDSINVVPMIDIMLVLLAIILTTASFIKVGQIPIDLPATNGQATTPLTDPTVITIDRLGNLYFQVQPQSLADMENLLAELDSDTSIVVRVDRQAAFGGFAEVIDLLKLDGFTKLSILVAPAGE